MARLDEDLIVELLSRLPVKSLGRFKCVSKRWRSLISDPKFAKIQLRQVAELGHATSSQRIIKNGILQTINPEALDDGEDDSAAVELHTPGPDPDEWFLLVGHCDGLVCLACEGRYMLYNPTTRQSRNISGSGLVLEDDVFHGLGYDSTNEDYKILQGVYVTSTDGSKEAAMEIFTLKSNSWRRIQNSRITDPYERGIYLHGALHWFVVRETAGKRAYAIVSFDMANEKFEEVLQLPDVDPSAGLEGLGVMGDRLFVYRGTWCDRFEAWTMNEYGMKDSWIELFNVSTDGIPGSKYWTKPLCCTKNKKIVFDVDGRDMVLFNPEDGTFKLFPIEEGDWESAIYVESLMSPYVGHDGH